MTTDDNGKEKDTMPLIHGRKRGFPYRLFAAAALAAAFAGCEAAAPIADIVEPEILEVGSWGPAGGVIIYAKPAPSDGWQYIEMTPGFTGYRRWASGSGATRFVGGTSPDIGDALANTDRIVAANGLTYPSDHAGELGEPRYTAAAVCYTLDYGGYDDWGLPTSDELDAIASLADILGFSGNSAVNLWSSCELMGTEAIFGTVFDPDWPPPGSGVFYDPGEPNVLKDVNFQTVCVRYF